MEIQLHITQGRTKGPRQPGDTTATPAHTHNHTGMHANTSVVHFFHKNSARGLLGAFTTQSFLIVFFQVWRRNINVHKYADETQVYINLRLEKMQLKSF